MQRLAQPEVLKSASVAAIITCVACFPRFTLWQMRSYPIWYLEAVLLLGSMVLWAFVFAWHTKYTGQPVFVRKTDARTRALATFAAILLAVVLHLFLYPGLRQRTPEDYPASLEQWVAMTLFTLAFNQLFLVFAPFAWCVRLFQRKWWAASLTVLFGVFVLVVKNQASTTPLPASLFVSLLMVRLVIGTISVYLYLRGGVTLV